MTPRLLFRIFSFAELVTWAGLITALILRATGVTAAAVSIAGGLHGFVFLSYCVITVFVWVNEKWKAGVGVLGLVSAVVPFATLPFELVVDRKGLLSSKWRLADPSVKPRGLFEHLQAWVLRHPWLALGTMLVLVAIVFTVLLWLGPPVSLS